MKFKSCFGMSMDELKHQHMHFINGNESIEMRKNGDELFYEKGDVPKFEKTKVIPLDVKKLVVRAKLSKITFLELPMAESEMIVKFHGQGRYSGPQPTIEAVNVKNEIHIQEKYGWNSFVGKLAIDIIVPKGFIYNNVSVKTVVGDILGYVRTNSLKIDTINGNTQLRLDGKKFDVNTVSGDVELRYKAKGKGVFNIDTVMGEIDLTLDNVSEVFVNGEKTRVFSEKYPLEIAYSSMNNNLKIR